MLKLIEENYKIDGISIIKKYFVDEKDSIQGLMTTHKKDGMLKDHESYWKNNRLCGIYKLFFYNYCLSHISICKEGFANGLELKFNF